jgi:hypothetical protein
MDLYRIIEDLTEERNRIQRIIQSIESMDETAAKPVRRARASVKKARKGMTQAARREVSARMKSYWAKRRQEEKPNPGHPPTE